MFADSITSAEFGLERVSFLNDLTGKMSEKVLKILVMMD